MSNETPSTRYQPADPNAKSTDVFYALVMETAKSVPGIGQVVAAIDKLHADHEMAMVREMLVRLERRTKELEDFVRTPEGASLTARALRIASREMDTGKIPLYVEALVALLPKAVRGQADFEPAARVLEDLSRIDKADLELLAAFIYSPSIPAEQLVLKPHVEPMPDVNRVRAELREILPTAMRLQGMGLLIVAPKPLTWAGSLVDVGEYSDFLRSFLHLTKAGRALILAFGLTTEANWKTR